jgi:hypothetical protein
LDDLIAEIARIDGTSGCLGGEIARQLALCGLYEKIHWASHGQSKEPGVESSPGSDTDEWIFEIFVPPVSAAEATAALVEQYSDPVLRHRPSMLWGTRGAAKSIIARPVATQLKIPLVDAGLAMMGPAGFPPALQPSLDQKDGIIFLDELTAADRRLRNLASSLILERRVGEFQLPRGWQVIVAGKASFHEAVSPDAGMALADRMFHFNVPTAIGGGGEPASGMHAAACRDVDPDQPDDTWAPLSVYRWIGATARGWRDLSNVLNSDMSDAAKRVFVQGRIGAANAGEFFGALREIEAGADVARLLAARPGKETAARLPQSLEALHGMIYGLLLACVNETALARATEIIGQLADIRAIPAPLIREAQKLALDVLHRRAIATGLAANILERTSGRRDANRRRRTI